MLRPAFQSSTGGQIDFVNQHTGSFTFHPRSDTNESKSLTGTRNSSQPCLEKISEVGVFTNEQSEQRCDTETHEAAHGKQSMLLPKNEKMQAFHAANNSSMSSLLYQQERLAGIAAASAQRLRQRLPKTYDGLDPNFIVRLKRDKQSGMPNRAIGCFPIRKVPDGKYRIFYIRPKDRNRLIGGLTSSMSPQDKIQKVGRGHDFFIYDKNSSQSPSKQPSSRHSVDK